MMATFAGTVTEIQILKSGTGLNGRPWTLYGVFAIPEGGSVPQKFTTFNNPTTQVGQKVTFEYEARKSGEYTDLRILEPKPARKGGPGPGNSGLILDRISSLEAIVRAGFDSVLAELARRGSV